MGNSQQYSLTHPQRRIWFTEIMYPELGIANNAYTFKLPQPVDCKVLGQVVNLIVEKNDGLRLCMLETREATDFTVRQYVAAYVPFTVDVLHFTSDSNQAYQGWLDRHTTQPFALLDSALFYFAILSKDNETILYAKLHHLISDNSTFMLLAKQIQTLYTTLQQGASVPAGQKPSYLAYIEQEKRYKSSSQFLEDKKFWSELFADLPEEARLSVGKGKTTNALMARQVFVIPEDIRQAVGQFCTEHNITLFQFMLTIFYTYMVRVSGKNDIVIGVPHHERHDPQTQEIMGMFVSTMPCRLQLSEELEFKDVVKAVSQKLKQQLLHSSYPYDILVGDLQGKNGSINHLFNYYLVQLGMRHFKDIEVENQPCAANFYRLGILINPGTYEALGLQTFGFDYQTAVFDDIEIGRIYQRLVTLLRDSLANPEKKISQLEIMPAEEEQQLLVDFNNTYMECPTDKTYHQLFEKQVLQTPNHIAAVYKEQQLTYRQLNDKANSLAQLLRGKGIRSDSRVGIMVGRSLDMLVGAMAIMKAGGAYLPIDPDYPQSRIDFMLEDSGATVLLSQGYLKDKAGTFRGEWIDLDDEKLYSSKSANLAIINRPSDLVYVIYTSGSTGKPKGVMIEHCNLVNLCSCENHYNGMTAEDQVASYSSFGFDASVWSNFPPLIAGATVHIIPEEIRLSFDQLNEYFTKHQITITFLPTQFCEQFMQLVNNKSLRILATGGEKLKSFDSQPYSLINGYGPTEYTVYTTRFVVDQKYDNIPIGKPLANTWAYVLDSDNNLLPIGVPGELCIAGAQMGRGYLNRPELSTEKFVSNPFQVSKQNAILYHTGDLVCWRGDGNLEYCGRMDQQVKIRGFRIEMGEIEQRLLKHEAVKEAVVIDRTDGSGNKYLCGYVVLTREVTIGELKTFIGQELPEYMIPAFLMPLGSLPMTANGKVDKRALPEVAESVLADVEYIAPQNEIEEKLVAIWQELLGIEQIGIHDNFFSLGGNSLKVTILAVKLQKILEFKLPVFEIFTLPTIKQLGERIAGGAKTGFTGIGVVAEADYYPVSSVEKRLYALHQMPGIGTAYHINTAIILEGVLDIERLGLALDTLINRHEALRTSFEVIDDELVQRVHKQIKYKKIFKEISENELDAVIKNLISPFDLGKTPLFNVGLLEIESKKHVLVFNVHHIVFDGISLGVFMDELLALYERRELPAVKHQYCDFAVWHNNLLANEEIKIQENYWLENLAGELPVLNLPIDYPRPASCSYEGEQYDFTIDQKLTNRLRRLASDANVTMFMLLLAAYNVLLSRYAGQEDIIVGSPVSGRSHSDLEGSIGMFVNTLPLRNYPVGTKSFDLFLEEVRQGVLQAVDNQDYPFEFLVNKLNLPRDASRNPLLDVMFTIVNKREDYNVKGLKVTPYHVPSKVAQFDLILQAKELKNEFLCSFTYAVKLFKQATIHCLSQHYLNILQEIATSPHKKISQIEMLSAKEKRQLLEDFSGIKLPYPKKKTMSEVFAEQVLEYPEHIALVFKEEKYTYKELADKTDRLAIVLRNKGVKPDAIVPILVNRSAEYIIAALAIIKAGGAYLPIDPAYPESRIVYMLEDSGAFILLSQPELKEKSGEFQGEWLDLTDQTLYQVPVVDKLKNINTPNDLVYVIYTSGSTGKPKGVMIEHRNLVSMCTWQNHYCENTADDIAAVYTGLGFDATVVAIFPFLLTGAAVHMIPEEIRLSIEEFNTYFEVNHITSTVLPTQLGEQFVELVDNKSLRILVTGGDKLKTFRPRGYRLINGYGPTEYTVASTEFEVKETYDNIPIGKPVGNTEAYLLDKYGNLQPIGVPGELCIAGPQMARGYLNRPETTAEKFVENPFKASQENEIMYHTGDLVRWLSDGNLEFLGRVDQQVKIRGYRIELGEIEQQILQVDKVRDAVVIDLVDGWGSKYLSAYLVLEDLGDDILIAELRNMLAKELPEYMIPSYFTQLSYIPLTANGKIDRRALPVPDISQDKTVYIAPTTDREGKIAAVWREVLGIMEIGIHDNFFCLGGNSIKAISVVAKLQKNFEISMNYLFEYQTIETLAKHITPRQDNLKIRLSQLKDLEQELDRDIMDEPLFAQELTVCRQDYEAANKKYLMMDLCEQKEYQHVLLTGATGYLGVHVLHELLCNRTCHVYLIIRGQTLDIARNRLREKLEYYFGGHAWQDMTIDERVTILAGDLQVAHLGLAEESYHKLMDTVEAIIHTAANVHHYGHYQEFYDSNVRATLELLELAKTGCSKDFHHVSTVSVGGGAIEHKDLAVFTEYELDMGQEHDNYYVRTKLEAEKVVLAARTEGINTNIFRVGNISFNSDSGLYQDNIEENAFYTRLKGFINIGVVPEKMDKVEFSFVDSLAKGVCLLTYNGALQNEIYHLYNPEIVKLSEVLTDKLLNISVNRVSFSTFIDYLYDNFDRAGFRTHIENIMIHSGWLDEGNKGKTALIVLADKTNLLLERLGFTWPKLEPVKLNKLIGQALKERIKLLQKTTLFANLSVEELGVVAGLAMQKVYGSDTDILWEGEQNGHLYLVMEGLVEVSRSSIGGWFGTIGVLGINEFIGEEGIVATVPSSITAEAIMGDVLVLCFSGEVLRRLIANNSTLALNMIQAMNERVEKLEKMLVSMG